MMENSNKLWGILLIAVLCVFLGLHISLDVADRGRNLDERLESIEKSLCTVEQIAVSNSGLSVRTNQFRGQDDVCSPSRPQKLHAALRKDYDSPIPLPSD